MDPIGPGPWRMAIVLCINRMYCVCYRVYNHPFADDPRSAWVQCRHSPRLGASESTYVQHTTPLITSLLHRRRHRHSIRPWPLLRMRIIISFPYSAVHARKGHVKINSAALILTSIHTQQISTHAARGLCSSQVRYIIGESITPPGDKYARMTKIICIDIMKSRNPQLEPFSHPLLSCLDD
jgi:hypothetical protein